MGGGHWVLGSASSVSSSGRVSQGGRQSNSNKHLDATQNTTTAAGSGGVLSRASSLLGSLAHSVVASLSPDVNNNNRQSAAAGGNLDDGTEKTGTRQSRRASAGGKEAGGKKAKGRLPHGMPALRPQGGESSRPPKKIGATTSSGGGL